MTPAWVIAIAGPVAARLSAEPRADPREHRRQGFAAVGRGVRVGHPGPHARLVGVRDLAQRSGPPTRPKSHSPGASPVMAKPSQRCGLDRAPCRRSPAPRPPAAAAPPAVVAATRPDTSSGSSAPKAAARTASVDAWRTSSNRRVTASGELGRSGRAVWARQPPRDDASRRSVPRRSESWLRDRNVPITVARPRRSLTGFPAPSRLRRGRYNAGRRNVSPTQRRLLRRSRCLAGTSRSCRGPTPRARWSCWPGRRRSPRR